LPQWSLKRTGHVTAIHLTLTPEHEAFLAALRKLEAALRDTLHSVQQMSDRTNEILDSAAEGHPLRHTVPMEQRPLLVQLLTQTTELLQTSGNRVRTTEARALYSEGMTMDQIAQLFGVSRQRVSTLLRNRAD
jgi:DNA-directed RNA polymerase sigma subunit (sigma70/sigma32)